eukprot:2322168-Rhodomonas_salina.1
MMTVTRTHRNGRPWSLARRPSESSLLPGVLGRDPPAQSTAQTHTHRQTETDSQTHQHTPAQWMRRGAAEST